MSSYRQLLVLLVLIAVFVQASIIHDNDEALVDSIMTHVLSEAHAQASLKLTVDAANANDWWIQIIASPAGIVKSISLTSPAGTQNVPNVDWDHNKGQYFVKQSSFQIPYGTRVTCVAHLKSGGSVTIGLPWDKGASATADGVVAPSNPGGSGNPGSGSSSGLPTPSTNPSIVKFVNAAKKYHRSGKGPQANITGEDSLRKRNKDALRKALNNLGIADIRARAFIFAAFGLESEQMYDWNGEAQRDKNKDWDKLWKNYSPLNMNGDMLKEIKFSGNPDTLNKLDNIQKTVSVCIDAVNKLGLEGFLLFHRAGRTGYEHPTPANIAKYKVNEFKDGLFNIMQKYVQDPSLFEDGRKVWADIPYV